MARELETRLGETGPPTAELAALARELRCELVWEAGGESHDTDPDRPPQTRVLAIDDDPLVLDSLRSLLADRGLDVVTEVDPRRVVALLAEVGPDLMILDVDMPEMDGIELCRRVRADPDHRGLRIVFLTTHTDPETVQAGYDAGADGHLAKPVVVAELLAWMQRHPAKSASLTDR
jgi:CheY-like chemotaxis protein